MQKRIMSLLLICGYDYHYDTTSHDYHNGICAVCGATDGSVRKGDLNNDGEITSADSVLLARFLADLQQLHEYQLRAADINGDGEITSADVVLPARHLAGLTEIN